MLYLQSKHRKPRPFYGTPDLTVPTVRNNANIFLKSSLRKTFLERGQSTLGGSANGDSSGRTRETDDGPVKVDWEFSLFIQQYIK